MARHTRCWMAALRGLTQKVRAREVAPPPPSSASLRLSHLLPDSIHDSVIIGPSRRRQESIVTPHWIGGGSWCSGCSKVSTEAEDVQSRCAVGSLVTEPET